jgi:hypothetical protein
VQRWLAAQVLHPEQPEAEASEALILAPPRGRAAERLGVYVDGYPARVREVLAETFPAVAHVIGPQALTDLTQRYLASVPLRSGNLNHAGAEVSAFLRDDPLTASLPFLADLAELEWSVARAFHAREDPPFDPTPLAEWSLEDWDHAVLRFQPSVSVVASDWPIREIWERRETPIEKIDIALQNRPDRVLVRRAGFDVACESLPAAEARALAALLAGQTLGQVAELLAAEGDGPAVISTWFARWMNLGMIGRISIAGFIGGS